MQVIAVAVVLLVVVGAGIWWQLSRSAVTVEDAGASAPAELLDDGVAVGTADAPVVEVYADFLCPHCLELEERLGATIDELVTSGEARLVLHPVSFIDPTESARSAAALGCAAETTSVLGFQRALFANAAGGFATERLVEVATATGLDDDVVQCVRDEAQLEWAAAVDTAARDRGVGGTPTIFVDGEELPIEQTADPAMFLAAFAELTATP